jgi:FkbM family methyltransferase
LYQNHFFIKFRSFLRQTGLTKISRWFISNTEYEKDYEKALLTQIKETDVIFDIGANRGLFTKKFLELTPKGKVFAFEPVPASQQILFRLKTLYNNLVIYPVAVGSTKCIMPMRIGKDNLNATSSLQINKGEDDLMVDVETLDDIIEETQSVPNVLKIDVEGFELEVLKGMTTNIKNKLVRVIGIEVHFSLLEKMGKEKGPKEIFDILITNGFNIKWIDHSHLVASRGR